MLEFDPHFFPLRKARTHEVFGPGAYAFAFALAARLGGDAMWVREEWDANQLNPNGFATMVDPAKLTFCNTKKQIETLAVAEEALRSGAVSLVVMVLSKPVGLTEGRRLQLAAQDGKSTGLAIIPEGMGSNAAETRWHCTPVFDARTPSQDSTLHRWKVNKNKTGTLGTWHVRWNPTSRRLIVVPPAGE